MNIRRAIATYAKPLEALQTDTPHLTLPSMPLSAEALTIFALMHAGANRILWVHENSETLENAHRDLVTLHPPHPPIITYFPPWESLPYHDAGEDSEVAGYRLRLLQQLQTTPPTTPIVIVTCIQALLQKTCAPRTLENSILNIACDDDIDLDTLSANLQRLGYTFAAEVWTKGQAARKGGLLDVWAPTDAWPTRIELFGPTVESLRRFDPATQRSVERSAAIRIPPACEWGDVDDDVTPSSSLLDYLQTATVVWSEPDSIARQAAHYTTLCTDSNIGDTTIPFDALCHAIADNANFNEISIAPDRPVPYPDSLPRFAPVNGAIEDIGLRLAADATAQARTRLLDTLYERARQRHHVAMFFDTEGSLEHFNAHLARPQNPTLHPQTGGLSAGFESTALRLTLVAESDLYGRRKTLRRRYDPDAAQHRAPRYRGARITDFTDMSPGDLVVHVDHGVGRYLGLCNITINEQQQEVLAIEYADEAKLYVPLSHAHLLSRYVGLASHTARLHKLGGKRWSRDKAAAQQAALDLAAELLEVQAARNLLEGHRFPEDTHWQLEFEKAFPFQETTDQIDVIRAVKADMESKRPMDRLICGDAGYGKTEVAMRAAFKAVQHGCQVAMLVPTTILAQQHYRTFSDRMAGFRVKIGVLSRFCTAGMRRAILRDAKRGQLDIIIGTHALVHADIRFANLGLIIIDEEQRFGVHHKEHLKHMKKLVDVLTLSATPIPRTLYMSMTGARDMSLLQTAPRERMAIETLVTKTDDHTIRDAVLRELSRDGQVYYLHNRVMTIQRLYDRLTRLVPEARIVVAHGRMKSSELARVMRAFAAGEYDILLCTTIIESGMDIPRANTILIDRADRFGIADLYQLRGRVGRSRHKAYAYLLLPPHGYIDSDARARIRALRKHAGLGAGFNLAIRDMEIRGAGNILGAAQSGHISAVGFGLYCQLLKRSIAKLKGETPPALADTELRLDFIALTPGVENNTHTATLPHYYISDDRIRISLYRRIAEATTPREVKALQQEMQDRFGPLPPAARRLLHLAGIRILAAELNIQHVEVRNRKLILKRHDTYLKEGTRFPTLPAADPDTQLNALYDHLRNLG